MLRRERVGLRGRTSTSVKRRLGNRKVNSAQAALHQLGIPVLAELCRALILRPRRASPHNPRSQKPPRYAVRPPPYQKSSLATRTPFAKSPGPRSRLYPFTASRFLLQSRTRLPTIHEEPLEEDERAHENSYDLYQQLDALAREDARGIRRQESEDADEMMDWDEETTLVAMLQDGSPDEDEEEELSALAHKLKAPMAAQGAALKQYLANTLIPVVTRVKEVHGVLEDKVDLAFGTGLLTFDEVCKRVENMALHDEDELKTAYIESQKNMKHLIARLERAYDRRSQLWTIMEQELDQCADRATAALECLPTEIERVIYGILRALFVHFHLVGVSCFKFTV
ncbi:hypothetical protein A0H81_10944 [Grifola frondosa]|uniref:Uncharacterized protein n=1 Tax=Grifola frondosa TaxID=5627 RepID=A0A1C7LX89_GRIFR|nr:hypothetical protein A0H81_10944 [Grifola frondosa]